MKKTSVLFLLIALFAFQSGCASVVGGRKQAVNVRSNPAGARVYIDGEGSGVTPFTVDLSHKKKHEFKYVMPGYQTENRTLTRTFNWWILGNLFIGGIPAIVDLAYGNQYTFDTDDMSAMLTPGQG